MIQTFTVIHVIHFIRGTPKIEVQSFRIMKTITIADGELKDKIKIHNRKNLYKEIGLCAPKAKINTSPFLNTSTAQINKVRVVLMKVTSTDKILTRY